MAMTKAAGKTGYSLTVELMPKRRAGKNVAVLVWTLVRISRAKRGKRNWMTFGKAKTNV